MSRRDFDEYDFGPMKHSGPGIASFILALAAGSLDAIIFVVAQVMDSAQPGAIAPGTPEGAVVLSGMCLGVFSAVVGIGLGIGGLCQQHRRTVFAVLGLVFNALLLLAGGCLFLFFLLMANL
jgi:hypothetical protein